MHDYQLEELGPRAFEQLVVAIARKTIGPGQQVYGAGPDGGREATYDGPIDWSSSPINWSNTDGRLGWDGYTVVQAKQCEHPSNSDPAKNLAWSSSETSSTLDDVGQPAQQIPRQPVDHHQRAVSSGDPAGGIDQIATFIDGHLDYRYGHPSKPRTLRSRGLRQFKVWHRMRSVRHRLH